MRSPSTSLAFRPPPGTLGHVAVRRSRCPGVIIPDLMGGLNVGGTTAHVDVGTVWSVANDVGFGPRASKILLAIWKVEPLEQSRPTFIPLKENRDREMR